MVSVQDIQAKLASCVLGGSLLDEFDEWFSGHTWNMHRDSDPEAQELAAKIELLLAEHSSGHRTESELRSEFGHLLSPLLDVYAKGSPVGREIGD